MRGRHEQGRDEILVLHRHAAAALAAPALCPVFRQRRALDVAAVRDRHDHVFAGDQILVFDFQFDIEDFGPTRNSKTIPRFDQLVADDLDNARPRAQDVQEVPDLVGQCLGFVAKFVAAKRRQSCQTQVQDGLGLFLGQFQRLPVGQHRTRVGYQPDQRSHVGSRPVALDQLGARRCRIGRGADQRDHLVDIRNRQRQADNHVRAVAGLRQFELRAASHDLLAEIQEGFQVAAQPHQLRAAADQRQHVGAEALLHGRPAVELVQYHFGVGVALQFDHDAHAGPVGFVAQIGNALDPFLADQVGDLLDHRRLVHLVRDRVNDDRLALLADCFHGRFRPHDDRTASGGQGVARAGPAHNLCPGREIRRRDDVQQRTVGNLRIVQQGQRRIHDLAQIVRRDVRRHAHRDPAGPVGEQVGEQAGEDDRLFFLVVVGRHEIDRALVQPRHQGHRGPGQARFGVAGGSGIIAVDIAEVALPLNQRVAQRKGLREADHRIVDGGIAMRVVLAQHLTHHAGGFLVRRVGPKPQLAHRPQQAAVDRFQPVAKIGQRTCGDRGQGIDEIPLGQRGLERRIDNCSGGIGLRGALIFGSHRLALPPARLGQKRGTQSFPRPFSP